MLTAQREVAAEQPLLSRLFAARLRSDQLFSVVRADSIYDRPIPERHRIIFYLGHLEAFDWNLLRERAFGLKTFHQELDRLFAFGIDPVGGGLPSDRPSDWPSVDAAREYVQSARRNLDENLLKSGEPDGHVNDGFGLVTLLNVAIEHRLMHLETLAYMLHQLPFGRKIPQANLPFQAAPPVAHSLIEIPSGNATLGLSRESASFGWDNEFEAHTTNVPAFEIDRYMVTNGQFREFIEAGGYENRTLWTEDDWNWKSVSGISHPVFWKRSEDGWLCRTMFSEIPLPLDWPVYVSHAEASAYARWAGKALATEQQWHRAAYGTPEAAERSYPWGDETPHSSLGNFDFQRWDPAPVNAYSRGRSAFGVEGMLGNGWEWTSSVFAPFANFEPFPFYRGYSADFFDGKHFVMKGGSARTAASMLRPTFRNWFQGHYQYVYAGFRCVNI